MGIILRALNLFCVGRATEQSGRSSLRKCVPECTYRGAGFCPEHRDFFREGDEYEWLFAPYSAFTVLSVKWRCGTDAQPHKIKIMVMADNKDTTDHILCSPWA